MQQKSSHVCKLNWQKRNAIINFHAHKILLYCKNYKIWPQNFGAMPLRRILQYYKHMHREQRKQDCTTELLVNAHNFHIHSTSWLGSRVSARGGCHIGCSVGWTHGTTRVHLLGGWHTTVSCRTGCRHQTFSSRGLSKQRCGGIWSILFRFHQFTTLK